MEQEYWGDQVGSSSFSLLSSARNLTTSCRRLSISSRIRSSRSSLKRLSWSRHAIKLNTPVSNHTASKTVTFRSFGICAQIPSNVD